MVNHCIHLWTVRMNPGKLATDIKCYAAFVSTAVTPKRLFLSNLNVLHPLVTYAITRPKIECGTFFDGGKLAAPINFPNLTYSWPHKSGSRYLFISHQNGISNFWIQFFFAELWPFFTYLHYIPIHFMWPWFVHSDLIPVVEIVKKMSKNRFFYLLFFGGSVY